MNKIERKKKVIDLGKLTTMNLVKLFIAIQSVSNILI